MIFHSNGYGGYYVFILSKGVFTLVKYIYQIKFKEIGKRTKLTYTDPSTTSAFTNNYKIDMLILKPTKTQPIQKNKEKQYNAYIDQVTYYSGYVCLKQECAGEVISGSNHTF